MAWLLGRSLYEALGNLSAESVDSPEAIPARLRLLVSEAGVGRDVAHTVKEPASDAGATSPREVAPLNWPGIVQQHLDKRSYPVLFLGSQCIRGRFASLALGIDLGGYKHILGGRDDGKTAELVWDLARRKLNA